MTQLPCPTESQEAHVFVAWLRMHHLRFAHVANETGHSEEAKRRAIRVKREGGSKGYPDYIIYIPSGTLYVELKRIRGSATSQEQKDWVLFLNKQPASEARICKGADMAINFVGSHLHKDDNMWQRKLHELSPTDLF